MRIKSLMIALLCLPMVGWSQVPVTETGCSFKSAKPLDGVCKKSIASERRILPYDNIREADVAWEKTVWRVLDVREKMNQMFVNPKLPLFKIIQKAAENGQITLYSTVDDQFSTPLTLDECKSQFASTDTILLMDDDGSDSRQIVTNEISFEDVKRFRIKEVWFFDKETSRMQVRIIGFAPVLEKYDDYGNFLFEYPMFWVYYPEARAVLGHQNAYIEQNDADNISWEDIFEMRFFSSYITKESNVEDRRIADYKAGLNALLESNKISNKLFDFEQDLWQN